MRFLKNAATVVAALALAVMLAIAGWVAVMVSSVLSMTVTLVCITIGLYVLIRSCWEQTRMDQTKK